MNAEIVRFDTSIDEREAAMRSIDKSLFRLLYSCHDPDDQLRSVLFSQAIMQCKPADSSIFITARSLKQPGSMEGLRVVVPGKLAGVADDQVLTRVLRQWDCDAGILAIFWGDDATASTVVAAAGKKEAADRSWRRFRYRIGDYDSNLLSCVESVGLFVFYGTADNYLEIIGIQENVQSFRDTLVSAGDNVNKYGNTSVDLAVSCEDQKNPLQKSRMPDLLSEAQTSGVCEVTLFEEQIDAGEASERGIDKSLARLIYTCRSPDDNLRNSLFVQAIMRCKPADSSLFVAVVNTFCGTDLARGIEGIKILMLNNFVSLAAINDDCGLDNILQQWDAEALVAFWGDEHTVKSMLANIIEQERSFWSKKSWWQWWKPSHYDVHFLSHVESVGLFVFYSSTHDCLEVIGRKEYIQDFRDALARSR